MLFVSKTHICNIESLYNVTPYIFLGSLYNAFRNDKINDTSLNYFAHDFSSDYGVVKVKDIFHIH